MTPNIFNQVGKKIDDFIHGNESFKKACESSFDAADADKSGALSRAEVAVVVDKVWTQIEQPLLDYGIKVQPPTSDLVQKLYDAANVDTNQELTKEEFVQFYGDLLKFMAKTFGGQVVRKYGLGALIGTLVVHCSKAAVKAVPVVGAPVEAILKVLPTLIVGPLLGVAATYGIEKGDILSVRNLFIKDNLTEESTTAQRSAPSAFEDAMKDAKIDLADMHAEAQKTAGEVQKQAQEAVDDTIKAAEKEATDLQNDAQTVLDEATEVVTEIADQAKESVQQASH